MYSVSLAGFSSLIDSTHPLQGGGYTHINLPGSSLTSSPPHPIPFRHPVSLSLLKRHVQPLFFYAYTLWQLTHSVRGSSPCSVLRALLSTWVAGRLPRQWEGEGEGERRARADGILMKFLTNVYLAEVTMAMRKRVPPLACHAPVFATLPFRGPQLQLLRSWRVPQTQTRVPHNFLRNESINEAFRGQLRVVKNQRPWASKPPSPAPSPFPFPTLDLPLVSCTASAIYSSVYFRFHPAPTPNNSKSLFQFEIFLWFIKKSFFIASACPGTVVVVGCFSIFFFYSILGFTSPHIMQANHKIKPDAAGAQSV